MASSSISTPIPTPLSDSPASPMEMEFDAAAEDTTTTTTTAAATTTREEQNETSLTTQASTSQPVSIPPPIYDPIVDAENRMIEQNFL